MTNFLLDVIFYEKGTTSQPNSDTTGHVWTGLVLEQNNRIRADLITEYLQDFIYFLAVHVPSRGWFTGCYSSIKTPWNFMFLRNSSTETGSAMVGKQQLLQPQE